MLSPIPGCAPNLSGPSDPGLAFDEVFIGLLLDSHHRIVGTPLLDPTWPIAAAAAWLYDEAPYCVLAHNRADDPRFVYANRTAQRCFEYGWEEITLLPSSRSAEVPDRIERQALIERVQRTGFATGYRGVRIAKSGRRFWIMDVTMWQLADRDGVVHGQAAVYHDWKPWTSHPDFH